MRMRSIAPAMRSFTICAIVALAAFGLAATGQMTTPGHGQERVPGLTGIDRADDVVTARQLLMEGIDDEMRDVDLAAGGQDFPLEDLKSHAYMISTLLSAFPHLFPPQTKPAAGRPTGRRARPARH